MPLDAKYPGQIMSIEREEGEFVQEGQTVVRLVDLSQVKVEGRVNTRAFNAVDLKGKTVAVYLSLAGEQKAQFTGRGPLYRIRFPTRGRWQQLLHRGGRCHQQTGQQRMVAAPWGGRFHGYPTRPTVTAPLHPQRHVGRSGMPGTVPHAAFLRLHDDGPAASTDY